jgi:hypothetical protein
VNFCIYWVKKAEGFRLLAVKQNEMATLSY